MMTLRVAENYDGIAAGYAVKPKRQIDEDRTIEEGPLFAEGGEEELDGDAQVEGAEARARLGLAFVGQTVVIGHRFTGADLDAMLNYDTRPKAGPFWKEFNLLPMMRDGRLCPALEHDAVQQRQRFQQELLLHRDGGGETGHWRRLDFSAELREVAEAFRKLRSEKDEKAVVQEDSDEDFPEPDDVVDAARPSEDLPAFFAPSDRWRRPNDFVAYMAEQFEKGLTGPSPPAGAARKKKQLTHDQAVFITHFAHACNCVWDDEQNNVPMDLRQCFDILLMGQGGSGKTAMVQHIVLPVIDFLFPPEAESNPPQTSLIVCFSWAQAENISTERHKGVSVHNACLMGVAGHRNADMAAGSKLAALERKWGNKRLLAVEEVGMIGQGLYNMLLYRSWQGRAKRYEVKESDYDKRRGTMGRMPITIKLGDFLQKQPVKALSLLEDMDKVEGEVPPENDMARKLFLATPLCFEFRNTKRFEDPRLEKLMAFMRAPGKKLPADVRESWNEMRAAEDEEDPRLREDRFRRGYMMGIY